jgi:hypothetical protein
VIAGGCGRTQAGCASPSWKRVPSRSGRPSARRSCRREHE